MKVTRETVSGILAYDKETGVFTWLGSRRGRGAPGLTAGSAPDPRNGHIHIRINGANYKAHRLAWLLHYGDWPTHEIDHINRDGSDNRILNLRLATRSQNQRNKVVRGDSGTGAKGVSFRRGRYWVRISVNGRRIWVSSHTDIDAAKRAYAEAALLHHGEFARLK